MTHDKVREIQTERFGETLQLTVFRFSKKELPFTRVKSSFSRNVPLRDRKILERNTEHYAKWVISLLEEHVSEDLKQSVGTMRRYDILSFFMNSNNEMWLSHHIFPMDFLNWGPVTLDDLSDDEYALDLDRLTTEAHDG